MCFFYHDHQCVTVWYICADHPSSPRSLEVSDVTKETVILSWKEPTDDGGSKIMHYSGILATFYMCINVIHVCLYKLLYRQTGNVRTVGECFSPIHISRANACHFVY